MPNSSDDAMTTPAPRPLPPVTPLSSISPVDDEQILRFLKLRRELTELHARLEYLKLMVSLGVSQ
jgi:hypothetical protein